MSIPLRIVEVLSSDAPTPDAPLTVSAQYDNTFAAYWSPGYCGCGECRMIVGRGATEQEAIEDYREQWRERYEKRITDLEKELAEIKDEAKHAGWERDLHE